MFEVPTKFSQKPSLSLHSAQLLREQRWALNTLNLDRATFICFSSFIFLLFIFHCWLDCIFYGIVSFCIQMMNQFHRESWKSVWIIWKYCKVLNFHEKLLNSELKWHDGIGGYLQTSPLEKYILCLIVHCVRGASKTVYHHL